ncbi:MAG: hypothetical protein PHX60_06210 [Giesbergeria sp.]|uniref:hypothetical protein n=1 Tax=Giesbergeria sp. TaxID=2818473 RepID=UPI0026109636|nr:hypothetical protein [Giesbergeria sp.]MDD2609277.1 hypothetical protein [Giesbergeria sp.]
MKNPLPHPLKIGRPLGGLLFALLACTSAQAEADEGATARRLKFSGFGTLGLTHHNNRDVGVISSFGQESPAHDGFSENLDSVLGAQLNWQAADDTSLVLQAVGRAGEGMKPQVRMGYVRQQFGQNTSVRLGRYRSALYFDADVTEIGYANLTARKPLPVYWISNNVAAIDGIDVQWHHSSGNAGWLLNVYAGESNTQQKFPLIQGDTKLRDIRGFALTYMLSNVSLRASRTWVGKYAVQSSRQVEQMNAGLQQAAGGLAALAATPVLPTPVRASLASKASEIASYANPFDNQPIYTSLGFNANFDNWSVMGGWVGFDSQSAMIGKYNSYSVTVGRSIGNITPYIELAYQRRSNPIFNTNALGPTGLHPQLDMGLAQLQGAFSEAAQFADFSMRSASVGMRWDVQKDMALKLQYDLIKTPSPYRAGGLATSTLPINNKVHLVSVVFDFIF